jgi:eukaryotic-like serine/threonine-protein kinase
MSSPSSGMGGRRNLRIGKYEVQAYIATGGMGAVYKALDVDLGRLVALKVLQPDLAHKPRVVERFRREARSAARLNHENIVTVYEFAEINGTFLLALEYVEGTDLHEHVNRKGKLMPDEARAVTIQAARALGHAHGKGIVHRDIKPSNFLLTHKDGQPHLKLTDFGLARAVSQEELADTKLQAKSGPAEYVARLTMLGTTVGTVDYMAPEQARDSSAADIRSDIYSLGCTLYFMLAGDCLFPEGTPSQRILKHLEEPPPDIRLISPGVPDSLLMVLERMLAKDPAGRHQTPGELLKDLELCEDLRPAPAPPLPPRRAVPPPLPSAAAAVAPPTAEYSRKPSPTPEEGRIWTKPGSGAPPSARDEKPKRRSGTRASARAKSGRGWPWAVAALGVLLAAGVGIVLLVVAQQPADQRDGNVATVVPIRKTEPDSGKTTRPVPVAEPPRQLFPIESVLPRLYQPSHPLVLDRLREDYEGPLANLATPVAAPVVYRVSRMPLAGPDTFRSLADACARAPMERPTVIEIHDNGPLFVPSLPTLVNRNLIVRPGQGFQPLLAWDVAADPQRAKRFMAIDHGSLALEDLDVVFQGTGGDAAGPPVLFQVMSGTLTAWKCSFSTASSHPRGIVLARLDSTAAPAKCRLRRCYARGANLTAVSVQGSGTEVLLDGCVLAGNAQPLLHVTAQEDAWTTLRVVRSTLVAGTALLRVDAAGAGAAPRLLWRGWDSVWSRGALQTAGDLVVLGDGVRSDKISWRVVNCIQTGWRNLLASAAGSIEGNDLEAWHKRWAYAEGDKVFPQAWPETLPAALEQMPAIQYQIAGTPLAFAATSHTGPLGADVAVVAAGRPGWVKRTYGPFDLAPVSPPAEAAPPPAPEKDGLYRGERLDLGKVDLGKHLQTVLATRKPAPRVVLYLYGAAPRPTSPIRVRGFDLVLAFVRLSPRVGPPALVASPANVRGGTALIEVEDGGLEIVGGKITLAGQKPAALPAHLLKVTGGDLRLFQCHLAGPLGPDTGAYQSLIDFQGAGDQAGDEPRTCALGDCLLESGKVLLRLRDPGIRLLLRNNVLIAGEDGLRFDFGAVPTPRLNVQCALEHNTVAVRRAVLDLPDTPGVRAITTPVVVRAEANVFLDPFTDLPRQATLLRCHGQAIARGALLWQGKDNGYDRRLHAYAVAAEGSDEAQPLATWTQLWGTPGEQQPQVLEVPATPQTTFSVEVPRPERLVLPPEIRARFGAAVPGADLARLGLLRKIPGP